MSSCSPSLTPFTQNLYEEFDWSDKEMKQIQFYLSEDIVLRKSRGGSKSDIDDGTIKVVRGSEVEEVVFKKGTQGVFAFSPREDRIAISFENAGKDAFLMFGPNKRAQGKFVLLAKDWEKNYGKIQYNGAVYETSSQSAYSSLMVDLKKARKVQYRKKTVGGRSVKG